MTLFWMWAVTAFVTCGMGWGAWKFLNYIHDINGEDDD